MANEVVVTIRGDDKASGPLGRVDAKAKGLGGTLKSLAPFALGAGAALGVLGAVGLKLGGDFESAFNKIRIGTGATGDELAVLKDSFRDTFKSVPVSMEAAADAISQLNTLTGKTGGILTDMATTALDAARLMGEDSTALIENFGRAINAFGGAAEDSAGVLDTIFVISQKTNVPMTELLGTVQTYGPVLRNLGFGLHESAILFGQLSKAGIDVSRVMPGINAFMRRLADEGVEDLRGGFEDVIEQIQNTTSDTEALNIATEAFGAEGAQRLVVAAREGAFELGELTDALATSEGAIARTAKETQTLSDRFTILKNRALIALEPALIGLVKQVERFADMVTEKIIPAIQEWYTQHQPQIQAAIEDFQRFLNDDLMPAIENIVRIFETVWPKIEPIVTSALKEVRIAIELVLNIISGIIKTILAIMEGDFGKAWENIKTLVDDVLGGIRDLIFQRLNTFKEIARLALEGLKALWDRAWEGIKTLTTEAFGKLVGFLVQLRTDMLVKWEEIKTEVTEKVQGFIDDVVQFFIDLPGRILDALAALPGLLFDAGRDAIRGFIDGLLSIPIPMPDLTPGFDIPGVPFVHSGTRFVPRDTLAVLQRGEMVIPAGPADMLRRGEGGIGAGFTYINYGTHNVVLPNVRDTRDMMREMDRLVR
jgi:TP901 family phage tail tape measure protein